MLCHSCRDIITRYCTSSSTSWISLGYQKAQLTWEQVKNSAQLGCEACDLISRLLQSNGKKYLPDINGTMEQATLLWSGLELELYEPGKFSSNDSQAALIDVVGQDVSNDNIDEDDGFERIWPGTPEYFYPLYSQDEKRRDGIQRDLSPRTDDDSCFDIARIWSDCCSRGHSRCRRESETDLPTRIIDVGSNLNNARLVESAGQKGTYVTLSHRWGGTLSFRTTQKNVAEHLGNGIPLNGMPATFKEAIVVCQRLGIKYLWIDALCIIQDCAQDWGQEAGKMASYYRHSRFTISALHARSSYGGLFVERPVQPYTVFQSPLTSDNDQPESLGLRLARPSFHDEMCNSPLASRGWVYQERVLSTAALYYGANQIFWECRSRVMSECAGWISHRNEALAFCLDQSISTALWNGQTVDQIWESVVTEFSKTQFTERTDKLAGILGVASRFGSLNNFAVGIWRSYMGKELLWGYDYEALENGLKVNVVDAKWKPRSPTWSWISVDYPIRFAFPVAANECRLDCNILNFDDLCKPDLTAYRNASSNLALKVKGVLITEKVNLGFKQRFGLDSSSRKIRRWGLAFVIEQQVFTLECQFDPGFQTRGGHVHALRIASYSGHGTTPVEACSWFLLLQQLEGSSGEYRRAGIGSGPLGFVQLAFRHGVESAITIV